MASTKAANSLKEGVEKKFKEQQEFQQYLKNIVKYSKKYNDAASDMATCGNEFARELATLSKRDCVAPYEKTSQFLFDYSTVLSQIGSVCTQMVEQIQTEFYSSLAQFTEHGFTEANAYKSKLEEASANYDAALSKIDDMSKKGKLDESKMNSLEEELNTLKANVVESTDDFQASMDHLDANKEFKFLRSMYQHLELQTSYFLVGHKLFANLMGKIEPVKKHLENLDAVAPNRNIMEGNLMKKGKSLSGAKKIYVILKQGQLVTIKGKKVRKLDMRLCTVRMANSVNMQQRASTKEPKEGKETKEGEYSFEIISAQKKYVFHTENAQERDKWVKALQNMISNSLNNSNFDKEKSTTESVALKILRKDIGNLVCADCDVRDPDWASINLGILVCLECSGVHRSLGTHISKVRSLTLDKWDPELLLFMRSMGNHNCNSIYEFNVSSGHSKPTKNTDRESREKYIKAKYVNKEFIPTTVLNANELSQALNTMVMEEPSNILGVMLLIAQGADTSSAVHSAASTSNILFYTALVQNGAQTTTALHTALTLEDVENAKDVTNMQHTSITSSGSNSFELPRSKSSPRLADKQASAPQFRLPPPPAGGVGSTLLPPPPPSTLPPPPANYLSPLPPPPNNLPPPLDLPLPPPLSSPQINNSIFTPPASPATYEPNRRAIQSQYGLTSSGGARKPPALPPPLPPTSNNSPNPNPPKKKPPAPPGPSPSFSPAPSPSAPPPALSPRHTMGLPPPPMLSPRGTGPTFGPNSNGPNGPNPDQEHIAAAHRSLARDSESTQLLHQQLQARLAQQFANGAGAPGQRHTVHGRRPG